ncbi:MAG: beta strand repeat-containing protein, partial [Pyrinomonadaceae bacterium]
MAALLIFAVLATAVTAISIASAESKRTVEKEQNASKSAPKTEANPEHSDREAKQRATVQEQGSLAPVQGTQARSVPVLTMSNAPDVPQCREILNQSILDIANLSTEDPGEIFEANRRAHPHMIEMPPPVECASELWQAVREPERAPVVPEIINTRQYSLDAVYNMDAALAASVGTNTDPSSGVEGYQGENSISIDPNNPLHIVAHSNTFFKDTNPQCQSPTGGTANTFGTMTLFGSSDGGQTWTYNCAPWPASVTGGVAGATFWFGSDPALAWDNQGRAYATYMLISQSSTASGASIVTARSSDNGATWQSLGTVTSGITSTTIGNDKEMMAIDNTSGQTFSHPGRIYVIWDAANAEKIAYSDNGSAWTTVNFASNTGAIGGNVVVGADGTVYAIWNRYNVETIVFSKSTDGGATWTAPAVIATLALQSFGANNLPPAQDQRGVNGFGAIDIDRNPNSAFFGTLYVSFPDFPVGTTSGSDINTYVIRSTNGGTNWSTRVKVNDDNFGATQFFPWLAVDQSDGTVNVSWIDSRIDPLNRKTQAVYARSSDGGVSFEPNISVTDGGAAFRNTVNYADENSTDNPSYNGNQYGDYTGIAAFNRQVHPLWTDSRMFFPTADTQAPTRREDNATTVITNCSAPVTVGAPSVNSSTAPNVAVTWGAPAGWGTNATNGTYSVYRNTTPTFPSGAPLASGLTATSYVDTTGTSGTTYYYFVSARNNCPGTALTPMSTASVASAAVVFGSAGTATGVLQGTVTAGASPLSGAVVTAGTFSATTNASGFYQIPAINAGTYTVSTSPAGYSPASVNGVVVNDGATTVQNLSLTPNSVNNCFTDTAFGDYAAGSGTGVDIASSPGDVKLGGLGAEAIDQSNSPASLSTATITTTTWIAQTFTAGKTGQLTKAMMSMGLSSGSTATGTVELRGTTSGAPNAIVLATATIGPVTNVGSAGTYFATFSTPATVTAGTVYALVLRANAGGSPAFGVQGTTNGYAGGVYYRSTTSGSAWTAQTTDLYFAEYVKPTGLQTSGNFVSSVKDSGAVAGSTTNWGTLTWNNASLPVGTTLQFQVAAGNSASGPFNFVGPDGTASTFFTTSGAALSQFNGSRYLKYKALFTGTGTVTPTLNDVTVCFNDVPSFVTTTLTAATATGTYGGTVNLSATLTDGVNGIGGKTIDFTLNGNSVGSATTTASGVATVSNVSLAGINAGSYPTGVGASFAGSSGYTSSTSTASLTVNKADTTTSVTVSNAIYDGNPHGATASVTGPVGLNQSLTVTYTGRNSTVYGPSTTAPTGAGDYTASASYAGDSNYNPSSDSKDYQMGKASQTINFGALADKSYGDADFTVSATATSGLGVSFGAAGACTVTGNTVHITGGGSCTITASQAGDSNYNAAPDVPQSFQIAKVNQTITFNPLGDKTYGDADFSVSASASSGLTVSFNASGACTVTGSTVHITGAGSCTINASQAGDSNYNAASDVARSFQIAKATATISLSNLNQTYDGTAKQASATTNPAGLNVVITYGPATQAGHKKSTAAAANPINAGSY